MSAEETAVPIEKIVRSLAEIAREIGRLEDAREVHLRSTHGRFNLFTTLLEPHEEVCLHTRYLEHLLNPEGTHDCDELFLELFLKVVGLAGLDAKKCTYVTNEHDTAGLGNIDIYIEFENAVLVIENKIYAGDQSKQLQRYFEYATQKKKGAVCVLYLTLDGHEPSLDSRGWLKEGEHYQRISYREDILKWLGLCLQHTYAFVNINQAMQQYKDLVSRLCGRNLKEKDMDKIKEMIADRPEIVRYVKQLHKIFEEIESAPLKMAEQKGKELGLEVKIEPGDWGGARAVRFSCPKKWGSKNDIILKIFDDSRCDLFAFVFGVSSPEKASGFAVVMAGFRLERDRKAYLPYCCEKVSLERALDELEGFVDKINRLFETTMA